MSRKLFQRSARSEPQPKPKLKPKLWRQGDVFILSVAELPAVSYGTRSVLAEGELTGHAHRLADPATGRIFSGRDGLFLEVLADSATIVHEEHQPIRLPRGSYSIRIQREYHPEEVRPILD